eukprot:2595644-Rhodomonas_salina.1
MRKREKRVGEREKEAVGVGSREGLTWARPCCSKPALGTRSKLSRRGCGCIAFTTHSSCPRHTHPLTILLTPTSASLIPLLLSPPSACPILVHTHPSLPSVSLLVRPSIEPFRFVNSCSAMPLGLFFSPTASVPPSGALLA